MPIRLALVALLAWTGPVARADDPPARVVGRVLDAEGRPAAGAGVAESWGANGLTEGQAGALARDRSGAALREALFGDEGRMEPLGESPGMADGDGRFAVAVPPSRRLMVLDRDRRHGAVFVVPPGGAGGPVEVRLRPLVRVSGAMRLAGGDGSPALAHATLALPADQEDPLTRTNLAVCGSLKGRFAFLVPPGRYEVAAISGEPLAMTVEPVPVEAGEGGAAVELGDLVLHRRLSVQERADRARARGTWGDLAENLGKTPPPWHLTDARGIAKDATLADFRGRWVALYFWTPDCAPCLGKQLPALMAFHDARRAQSDRFAILALCFDPAERTPDLAALDRRLEPARRRVWGGRDLPFPVLLDNGTETYERFGLEGRGVSNLLLIDPAGRLVAGDLDDLAKALDAPAPQGR